MESKWETLPEKLADRVTNIILLGFFWVICSIPIITIGASSTALNEAMHAYLFEEDKKVLKTFFASFKQHFKQATAIWMINLVLIALLGWDILYYRTGDGTADVIAASACAVCLTLLFFELIMVFIVLSKEMTKTVKETLTTALDLAFTCFLESIFVAGITIAVPVASVFLFPSLILVLPGVIAYLDWQIIPNMLVKYKFKKGNRQAQRSKMMK